jgi:cyclic pyranopterin phosphate synthase
VDLRAALRGGADDAELLDRIRGTWQLRADRYSEQRDAALASGEKRIEMFYIGG